MKIRWYKQKTTYKMHNFAFICTCSFPDRLHQDSAWVLSWRSRDHEGFGQLDDGSPGSQWHLLHTHINSHRHIRKQQGEEKKKKTWKENQGRASQLIEFWETKGKRKGRWGGIIRIRGGMGNVKSKSMQMEWSWRRWKNRQHAAGLKPNHLIHNEPHTQTDSGEHRMDGWSLSGYLLA